MPIIILAFIGLIPAVALCVYIYVKDRAEKEPVGLLLLLLGLGAATGFPAGRLEGFFESFILNPMFSVDAYQVEAGLENYLSAFSYRMYHGISAVFGVALIEEGLKWLVLFLVTRKNKNFNSLFDGVIYAVFVSLGFAALENVMYSIAFGLDTALGRILTAVPAHMFFAVIMGTFYTRWHASKNAHILETGLKAAGYLTPRDQTGSFAKTAALMLALSLVAPVLTHALYDYCLFIHTSLSITLFYIVLAGLYAVCFVIIHRMSKQDSDDVSVATAMVFAKHPSLVGRIQAAMGQAQAQPAAPAGYPQAAPVRQPAAPARRQPPAWQTSLDGSMRQYAPQQGPAGTQPGYRRGYPAAALTAITGVPTHNGNISVQLPNGDHYGGAMTAGKANGYGVYYFRSGRRIAGFWKDGYLMDAASYR